MKKWIAAGLALVLCGVPVQMNAANKSDIKVVTPEEKISDSVYHEKERLTAENVDLADMKIPV